ncbi:hypothetical protein GCM10010289_82700 [Streptomyces violascens]|nr:hypothetical protein GCM10010289_82700 [Streptomyces violascens]
MKCRVLRQPALFFVDVAARGEVAAVPRGSMTHVRHEVPKRAKKNALAARCWIRGIRAIANFQIRHVGTSGVLVNPESHPCSLCPQLRARTVRVPITERKGPTCPQ